MSAGRSGRHGPDLLPWAEKFLKTQFAVRLAGALACAGLTVLITIASVWVIWFGLSFVGMSNLFAGGFHPLSWGIMACLFLAYPFVSRQFLEELPMEGQVQLDSMWIASQLTGNSLLAIAGPRSASTFVKVIFTTFLLAPGGAWTSYRLLQDALTALRTDPRQFADAVATIYGAGGRVAWERIERCFPETPPKQVLERLKLVEGLIYLSSSPPGFTLTDSLRKDIDDLRRSNR